MYLYAFPHIITFFRWWQLHMQITNYYYNRSIAIGLSLVKSTVVSVTCLSTAYINSFPHITALLQERQLPMPVSSTNVVVTASFSPTERVSLYRRHQGVKSSWKPKRVSQIRPSKNWSEMSNYSGIHITTESLTVIRTELARQILSILHLH